MRSVLHDLAGLIAPVPVKQFLREYWERKPLYITGHPDRFQGLFDLESFWRALGEMRFSPDQRRMYVKAGRRLPNGDHREIPLTAGQVPHALAMGLTVQGELLDLSDERLRRLMLSVRRELGIAAQMDVGCFISPDGSGYGAHFDATAMWVMQIEGRKRWYYAPEVSVPWPRANFVPTAEDRARGVHGYSEERLICQVLSPGDVLYLPAGTWHRPEAIGQSVHIDITVIPSNPLELLSSVLGERLMQRPEWRHLPSAPGPDGLASARRSLGDRLRELKASIDDLAPSEVARAFAARIAAEPAALSPSSPGPLRRDAPLTLSQHPRFSYAVQREGEKRLLLLLGDSVVGSLPVEARGPVARMFRARRFTVGDVVRWDPDYAREDVQQLLEQLLSLGCLRRDTGSTSS